EAGAARPADGHVAGFGEFQEADVVAAPADGEVAASELDRGAACRLVGGWMRCPRGRCGDSGCRTGCGSERLGVDLRGVEAEHGEGGADLLHELCWTAEVCVGVARWLEVGEQGGGETAGAVEVVTLQVSGSGAAVADVGADVRERREERAGLGGEGVVAAAACAVQPPDLSL